MASPGNSTEKYDVALSFADQDRPYVERVAAYLRAHNVKLFYDKYEEVALWGKNLYTSLSDVYSHQARYTVIFISKYYKQRDWTNHELTAVQERALEDRKEYILPVRFDDTDIPGLTKTIGYLSLRDKTPEEFAELLRKKLVLEGLIADTPMAGPGSGVAAVAALPLAPTTEFVAEQGPPPNPEAAAPIPLPQQLAAQPPALSVVIEQPPATRGRKPLYIASGLAVLCVGVILGYLLSPPPEPPPADRPPPTKTATSPPPPAPPPPQPASTPTTSAPPPTTSAPSPPGFGIYLNYDMIGGDIGTREKQPDIDGCRTACRQTSGCVAYSYDRHRGYCYLKGSLNPLSVDGWSDTGVRSGQPNPVTASTGEHFCPYRNISFSGDGQAADAPSAASCQQACRSSQSCSAYAFDTSCTLYRGITGKAGASGTIHVRRWDPC